MPDFESGAFSHSATPPAGRYRAYNEGRPKKLLGGLTPAAYARQLAGKAVTVSHGLKSRVLLKPGERHMRQRPA